MHCVRSVSRVKDILKSYESKVIDLSFGRARWVGTLVGGNDQLDKDGNASLSGLSWLDMMVINYEKKGVPKNAGVDSEEGFPMVRLLASMLASRYMCLSVVLVPHRNACIRYWSIWDLLRRDYDVFMWLVQREKGLQRHILSQFCWRADTPLACTQGMWFRCAYDA